jgi:UDPglucose--hexose-1-phosphate uridylyltransferase
MRRDPVTRKWVIVDVASNPVETVQRIRESVQREYDSTRDQIATPCDFCPGKETTTESSIMELVNGKYQYGNPSSDWNIRVIPNRDPVFRIEGNLNRRLVSMYDVMDAVGAHEIIIENRMHADWDELNSSEVADIIRVYLERMKDLSKDARFGHLYIYKNYGRSSNSSMPHPHSTITASPSVPERIRRELESTRKHFQMKERCLFCDINSEETRRKQSSGLIRQSENFVTLSPFFASHPFETWILPRLHNSDFRNLNPALTAELADALQYNLRTVKSIVGPLSYSLLLFTRPNRVWGGERDYWETIDDDYHWHFKFFPRFPRLKGFHRSFSAGTGYMINPVPPEIAAELMRNTSTQ